MKKHIIKYLHFTLGCFIMALAINVFLVQHHFLSGGIAGLAMLIYYIAWQDLQFLRKGNGAGRGKR